MTSLVGRRWSTLTPAEREGLPVGTVMRWSAHGSHGKFARIADGWCRVEDPLDTFGPHGDSSTGERFAPSNVIEFVPVSRTLAESILAADEFNAGDPICLNKDTGDRWELVEHIGTVYRYEHRCHPRVGSRMLITVDTNKEQA